MSTTNRHGDLQTFHTIGSMAVAKFEQLVKTLPDFNLLNFLGKQRVGRRIEPRRIARRARLPLIAFMVGAASVSNTVSTGRRHSIGT